VRRGEKNGGIEGLLFMVVASAIRSYLGRRSGHVGSLLVKVARRAR